MHSKSDFFVDIGADYERTQAREMTAPLSFNGGAMGERMRRWVTGVGRFLLRGALRHKKSLFVGLVSSGLVAAASVNAVFLQVGSHPAPIFGEKKHQHTASVDEAVETKISEIIVQDAKGKDLPNPLVREIQAHLAARGYYASEIDGLNDARTRAAIGLYQRANNDAVTNEPSKKLLENIRLSSPDALYHAAARRRIAAQSQGEAVPLFSSNILKVSTEVIDDREKIKQAQSALAKLGYHRVIADGVIGPITRDAVLDFKQKNGLNADSSITADVYHQLITKAQDSNRVGGV